MKRIGTLLVVVGVLIIGYPLFSNIYNQYQNDQMIKQIENKQNELNKKLLNDDNTVEAIDSFVALSTVFDDYNSLKSYEAKIKYYLGNIDFDDIAYSRKPQKNEVVITYKKPEGMVADDGLTYIGTIQIPKINVNLPVVDGTTDKDIKNATGHMLNTAYPGQIGNSVIVGHRGYTYGRIFNRLDEMDVGDKITVQVKGEIFTYEVYKVRVVLPTDTSVINQTNKAKVLTVITCTPLYSSDYRLVVHAILRE